MTRHIPHFDPSGPPVGRMHDALGGTKHGGGSGWLVIGIAGLVLLASSGGGDAPQGTIAYTGTDYGFFDIFTLDASSGERTGQLTDNQGDNADPDWSPDGSQVVFTSNRDDFAFDIFLANADGSDPVNLTGDIYDDGGATFAPPCDGCPPRIAFHSDRDGDYDVYLMDLDTRELTQLTDSFDADGAPTWSPDGTQIAFMSNRTDGFYWQIFVLTLATGELQLYTPDEGIDYVWPDWSPDGSTIAYVSTEVGWFRIRLMDADCTPDCGANKRLLIPDYNPDEVSPGWANEYDPAWSPDSNWIAFSSFRDPDSPDFFQQDYEIFIVRPDGTDLTQLTDNEFIDDYTPAWKE